MISKILKNGLNSLYTALAYIIGNMMHKTFDELLTNRKIRENFSITS